jgi:hypothetical protein
MEDSVTMSYHLYIPLIGKSNEVIIVSRNGEKLMKATRWAGVDVHDSLRSGIGFATSLII